MLSEEGLHSNRVCLTSVLSSTGPSTVISPATLPPWVRHSLFLRLRGLKPGRSYLRSGTIVQSWPVQRRLHVKVLHEGAEAARGEPRLAPHVGCCGKRSAPRWEPGRGRICLSSKACVFCSIGCSWKRSWLPNNGSSFFSYFLALFRNVLQLFFFLRLKNGKKKEDSSFIQRGENTTSPNNSMSFLGIIAIIVLTNSISDLEDISFLPSLDDTVSNAAELH